MPSYMSSKTVPIVVMAMALGAMSAGCCKRELSDPAVEQETQFLTELVQQVRLPAAAHAKSWVQAPIIRIRGDEILVDGAPAGRFGSETGTQEVRSLLKGKRELWQQLNAGREFPGIVLLAAGRDTPGSRVASIANAAAKAGFPRLHVIVHAVDKGKLSPANLGVASVRINIREPGDSTVEPDGMRLHLAPGNMAVGFWRKGNQEGSPEPVAMIEEKGADGTMRLPGLASAVGRTVAAHKDERRIAVVSGMKHLSLAKVIGVTDVFHDPKASFEVLWTVYAD